MKLRSGTGFQDRRARADRCWCGQAFQLADARVGLSWIAAGESSSRRTRTQVSRHAFGEQSFRQELHDREVGVFVDNKARQLVGLAEAQAAGVVGGIEQRLAASDGRAQARRKQLKPRGLIEGFARDEAQRDLRRRAENAVPRSRPRLSATGKSACSGFGSVTAQCRTRRPKDGRHGVDPMRGGSQWRRAERHGPGSVRPVLSQIGLRAGCSWRNRTGGAGARFAADGVPRREHLGAFEVSSACHCARALWL